MHSKLDGGCVGKFVPNEIVCVRDNRADRLTHRTKRFGREHGLVGVKGRADVACRHFQADFASIVLSRHFCCEMMVRGRKGWRLDAFIYFFVAKFRIVRGSGSKLDAGFAGKAWQVL